jgi:hypothetical protein
LRDRGFFSAADGFAKIGVYMGDCYPDQPTQVARDLRAAGLSDAQIVNYIVNCANPQQTDAQNAVLKFKQAGVTHVFIEGVGPGGFVQFSSAAQQALFKPKYGIPDENIIVTSNGSLHPDYDNIDGAIAITPGRYGEEKTAGVTPSAGTAKCNAMFAAKKDKSVYEAPSHGIACANVDMFATALRHAPAMTHEALAAGLQAAKTMDFSFPMGTADFSGNMVTWAGQFSRATVFRRSCTCWQLAERDLHPPYR